MFVAGITAVAAFLVFTVYRGFLPSGDMDPSIIAPGAYAFAASLAVLTVVAVIAFVVLLVVWLVMRSRLRS